MHSITIAGRAFEVQPKYAAGHTLTANEASALNQTYFENLRNNFAGKAKEGADQAAFNEYAASYEFGVRSAGGSRDPVEAETMELARESIRDLIRKSGKKLSDYKASAITAAAEKLLNTKPEQAAQFRELARQRVEQMRAAASNEVEGDQSDLLASLDEAQAEAAAGETAPTEGAAPSGRKGKVAA